MPNLRSGKTARLYLCQCGERIWDDKGNKDGGSWPPEKNLALLRGARNQKVGALSQERPLIFL
jgi:hypothetical protein